MKKLSDFLNLILENIYPFIDPRILENIVANVVNIKLFNKGFCIMLNASSKGFIVGERGNCIGIV